MSVTGSILSEFWNDQLVANSEQGLFLVLVGFLVSFGFIRLSTRLMRSPRVPWWPGSVVSDSGVHLHHLLFGNGLMIAAGALGFWFFDTSPGLELCALAFGVGVGLTLDEFALLVHLDDVYWSQEGRSSIDATVIAVAAMGLILVGVRPFDVETGTAADVVGTVAGAAVLIALAIVCFAKQRLMHGTIGFLILPLAAYGAVRIGKPGSPWARRFYGRRDPGKQTKAEERFAADRRTERFKERFRDAVGGVTEEAYEAMLAQRAATEAQASELRERAEQVAVARAPQPRPRPREGADRTEP